MYLKRVEIHGFKSFADKTTVEFIPGVNGIVGPNGCGKSNITDAIRWVLGEKSAKALRGEAMSDVIFSGSEDRKPLNLAEVTLVFDNEDHYLPYESNEVEITRRLYRIDKEAEYFINRNQCRLKDIVDLIMDTGLGRDSLSIISQNNINEFVRAKSVERRALFEEAAGVAKYKVRKKESVNKLERTTTNLERVEDIVLELEKQINPLKRQKEKAERYLTIKEELEDIEISVLVKMIASLSNDLKEFNDQLDVLEQDKVTDDSSILLKENQSEDINKKMFNLDQEINKLQGELLASMNKVSELETQKVEIDTNRKHLLESSNKEDLDHKIQSLKEVLQDALNEYNDRVSRYEEVRKEKEDIENKSRENEHTIASLRREIEYLNINIHKYRENKLRLKDEIENKSGYPYGVRSILNAKNSLNGILGTIGDLIDIKENFELALSTTLGGATSYIVTKSQEDAKKAISFLHRNKAGRATFLPVDKMLPRYLREDHKLIVENFNGYLGVASDFVSYPSSIDNVIKNQLGNVIICDTLNSATEISRLINNRYRIVTLEGDVINVGGSLTGGSFKNAKAFNAKKELDKVEMLLKDEEKKYNDKRILLNQCENNSKEFSSILMQKQMSFAKLELVMSNKQSELHKYKMEYEELSHQSIELDDLKNNTKSNELLDELNKAKKYRDTLQEEILSKREIRMNYVNLNEELEIELRKLRKNVREIESMMTKLKVNKTKCETEMENYLSRLTSEYAMTYEHALTIAKDDIDVETSLEKVKDLRLRLASLGNVNIDSIEQYKEVSERYHELNENRIQLLDARETLLKAIDDMDQIMVERFTETFDKINVEFNKVFRYLFGGGSASLSYSDPSNILETGIEIHAQPPGKSAKLNSFSGGENALIALSCLFAIISVRPVPLCILDEVEAALDMANVERFAKYLKHFSSSSQFLVVTHREGTMAECDLLYGATMQQKGVTKLVSVKLEEAQVLSES